MLGPESRAQTTALLGERRERMTAGERTVADAVRRGHVVTW